MIEAIGLSVAAIRPETDDAVTIVLDDPRGHVGGTSGQHVVLHVEFDGTAHRRVYSLSSSPELGHPPAITVKRQDGGLVSPFLVGELQVGDRLAVEPAAGVFGVNIDPTNQRTYYGFMAGSGSVPIVSIARTVLATEAASVVHLAYGNRTEADIIFSDELDQLVTQSGGRLTVTHLMSEDGQRIDHTFVNDWLMSLAPESWDVRYLVSGPPGMRDEVVARLASLGAPDHHILVEYYVAPTRSDAPQPFDSAVVSVEGGGAVTVPSGDSILGALGRGGESIAWACQSGVCGTCKAVLVRGEVDPGFPFALSEAEIAAGIILTCISRPLSAEVELRLPG